MIRVVHYLNQFFGQIGGEDQAGVSPQAVAKPVGPGMALQAALGDGAQVVATVICGDNYFAEQPQQATEEVIQLIRAFEPQLVVTGPAFNAGRYGPACGAICQAVQAQLGIPAVTGMYPENPGVELYRQDIICVATGPSAAGMRQAMSAMAVLGLKLAAGKILGPPEAEGYLPRGIRKNNWAEKTGAARAVDMLLAKLQGLPYRTELPMPSFERVSPASPVHDLSSATVALVTEGGIVPKGNPDRLESALASKFLSYSLEGIEDLSGAEFQSVHGGYSNVFANEDPDRAVVVVGGGDTALEEALYLAKIAKRVFLVHRRDAFRGSRILQQRVAAEPLIEVLWNTVVTEILANDEGVRGVVLRNKDLGSSQELEADGVFIFIGFLPNNQLVPQGTKMDADGYVLTDEKCETNLPGIYAVGDLRQKYAKQIITAAADGCTAALAAALSVEMKKAEL